jgi:hypothetical protein
MGRQIFTYFIELSMTLRHHVKNWQGKQPDTVNANG